MNKQLFLKILQGCVYTPLFCDFILFLPKSLSKSYKFGMVTHHFHSQLNIVIA